MFRLSIYEIIVVGIPMLAFATLANRQPDDIQCVTAFWGGWLGALAWFVLLRLEYINPYKFIFLFMLIPGLLLGSTYYVCRKPAELKPIAPAIQQLADAGDKADAEETAKINTQKKEILTGLLKESAYIWGVGSFASLLVFFKPFRRIAMRCDYALKDCCRSRALLGRKPGQCDPRQLPGDISTIYKNRISIPSDTPMQPRVREPLVK
jgi:hypothetical protein